MLACVVLALCAAWYGIRRRGPARLLGIGAAALLLCGAVVLVIVEGHALEDLLVVAAVAGALAAAREAFKVHVNLPPRAATGKARAVLQPPLRRW